MVQNTLQIIKPSEYREFTIEGAQTAMTMLDFWRWSFSDVAQLRGEIATFLVGKALEIPRESGEENSLQYRDKSIAVRQTDLSDAEPFDIAKAHDARLQAGSVCARKSEVYVFCLQKEEGNPLELGSWEFYVVPTVLLNRQCGNQKTLSYKKVRKLAKCIPYSKLKTTVDAVINYGEKYDAVEAHAFSRNHMKVLQRDKQCGCFFCLSVFDPAQITEWLVRPNPCDRYGTAVCPHCGVDAVIGESAGYPLTIEFLQRMKNQWF